MMKHTDSERAQCFRDTSNEKERPKRRAVKATKKGPGRGVLPGIDWGREPEKLFHGAEQIFIPN